MNKPKLPPVYFQVKKLKEFWLKSKSESKDMYIAVFNDSLKEIEETYLLELEMWEEKQELSA